MNMLTELPQEPSADRFEELPAEEQKLVREISRQMHLDTDAVASDVRPPTTHSRRYLDMS